MPTSALSSAAPVELSMPRSALHLPHLIKQELFRDALARERKRVDRSSNPLLLLLVSGGEQPTADQSTIQAVVAALTAVKRKTDIIGWFVDPSIVGVILAEIAPRDPSVVHAIVARFRCELSKRLPEPALSGISIQLHVHPEFTGAGQETLARLDPLLPPAAPRPVAAVAAKRALDIAGSLALLFVLSPLMLLTAVLIKITSRGPILFKQLRIGEMAKPFTMLKFRTMRCDVDHQLHKEFVTQFIKSRGRQAPSGTPQNGAPFKIAADPRITPIGRFLRQTSLDELPQFFNVLRGEMSLVGPRPPLPYEVDQYDSWHLRRLREARPGITGLWQVTGRSRTTFDEMVRLDLRYAKAPSLWTDIKILLATPAAVISGKGAR